jgi:hypothetical protein
MGSSQSSSGISESRYPAQPGWLHYHKHASETNESLSVLPTYLYAATNHPLQPFLWHSTSIVVEKLRANYL